MKLSILKLTPTKGGYELLEDYIYKDVVVPKGFITDGVTIKIRLLYSLINKYDPRIIEAVVVHDRLCELEQYEKADSYFDDMLPNIWQKKFMVTLVKIYHKVRYGR